MKSKVAAYSRSVRSSTDATVAALSTFVSAICAIISSIFYGSGSTSGSKMSLQNS